MAEREHRHVIETSVTLLQTAQTPPKFWSLTCQTAIYLINRMHTPILSNKSPFEALYGAVPMIQHLRTFGCACYPLLRPYNTTKVQPKTTKCIFLGYASKYKRFICYAVSQHKSLFLGMLCSVNRNSITKIYWHIPIPHHHVL